MKADVYGHTVHIFAVVKTKSRVKDGSGAVFVPALDRGDGVGQRVACPPAVRGGESDCALDNMLGGAVEARFVILCPGAVTFFAVVSVKVRDPADQQHKLDAIVFGGSGR